MDNKVITSVNKSLINDTILISSVAETSWGDAAIYDNWAERESVFPYIVLQWSFFPDNHFAKRNGVLSVDVFTKGPSTVDAENIRTRVINILDKQFFESEESGLIRLYLDSDQIVPDEHNIVHWSIDFSVIFWRKEFIQQLID